MIRREKILDLEQKAQEHEMHLNLLIASQSKKGVNQVRKELKKQKTMFRKVNEDVEPDENALELISAMNKK